MVRLPNFVDFFKHITDLLEREENVNYICLNIIHTFYFVSYNVIPLAPNGCKCVQIPELLIQ